MVGPGAHRALNVESTRMILDSHDYAGVSVEASTTPYRGWRPRSVIGCRRFAMDGEAPEIS
jgi:hypothetical protein